MPARSINPEIFKAYDIRGVVPTDLDDSIARDIGRAFVAYLQATRIAVTHDMRLSSPSLAAAFIEGACQQGADVVDYGLAGTDMLYYAVAAGNFDGGAQITASHNPKQWNGMKMVAREAVPLSGEAGIGDIREMVTSGRFPTPSRPAGRVTRSEILNSYVAHVLSFVDVAVMKPFHAVLDAGSGIAGLVAPPIFDRLPCRTTRLCFTVDGTFPTHEANPLLEENRRDITERVIRDRADIGIAWDGDADRCFFIDGRGEFVPGDFVTALLAESFLLKHPGSTIIYDLRASYAVKDTVERYGGRALMNRVGHAFIKRRMRDEQAIFGGEVTGHYYFRDNFFADNGFIPALLILELMSKKEQTLEQLLEPFRSRYFISGEINTKVSSMAEVAARLDQVAARYADARVYRIDGVSVEYPDWHFNLRPSNTEPLLRLNLEGLTAELMQQKRDEVLTLIRG